MDEAALKTIEEACVQHNAAVLSTDICPGCYGDYPEIKYPVLISLPLRAGDRTYDYISLFLCPTCTHRQDYNTIKRNLNYLILECQAFKLND